MTNETVNKVKSSIDKAIDYILLGVGATFAFTVLGWLAISNINF